jgi:hypothetical protein
MTLDAIIEVARKCPCSISFMASFKSLFTPSSSLSSSFLSSSLNEPSLVIVSGDALGLSKVLSFLALKILEKGQYKSK